MPSNYQIVCTDDMGKEYDVSAEEMRLYTSAHGVHIVEGKVLLVKDSSSGFWRFPGGLLDRHEKENDGMKRGIIEESGIYIDKVVRLLTIIEEDYYDLYRKEGYHATRMFYLIGSIQGGTLLASGNGASVSASEYISLDKALHFHDSEMKKKYRGVLEFAKSLLAS